MSYLLDILWVLPRNDLCNRRIRDIKVMEIMCFPARPDLTTSPSVPNDKSSVAHGDVTNSHSRQDRRKRGLSSCCPYLIREGV